MIATSGRYSHARARPIQIATVSGVCKALERAYGRPRLGNPQDPLDDLVFVVLSNRTGPQTADRAYVRIKATFKTWNDVLARPAGVLRTLLRPAGLSNKKTRQIRAALRRIKKDFGDCNLKALQGKAFDDIQAYLVSLPGVSDKVAKCVMMFTMGAQVLPVDVHVHRIATRLGWTIKKRADQCHEELEALIPPDQRYAFHVGCILHGRTTCRAEEPTCKQCCIQRHCSYTEKSQ